MLVISIGCKWREDFALADRTKSTLIYTAFRQYAVPDYRVPGSGLGNLPKANERGWTLVPSARAQEFAIANTEAQVAKY